MSEARAAIPPAPSGDYAGVNVVGPPPTSSLPDISTIGDPKHGYGTDYIFGKGKGPPPGAGTVAQSATPQPASDPLAPVMARIAGGESGGNRDPYTALYGGGNFGFPDWSGRPGPAGPSHAAGRYQFEPATWKQASREFMAHGAQPDFNNPADQEHVARFWAVKRYHDMTGRNLSDDASRNRVDYAALAAEWPSLSPKTHAGTGERPLQQVMFGDLGGGAKQLADLALARLGRADEAYQRQMRSADDIRGLAMARERRLEAEESRPPQNMHEAWSTWGGVASALALLGGFIGRGHMTGALGAAGAMMQAANEGDQARYDRSYRQWKDHLEMGDRAIRRFNEDANRIANDASKGYDHQLAELDTLSKIYQLPQAITHQQIQQQSDQLRLAQKTADIAKAQNTDTETRNATRDILVKQHPDHPEWKTAPVNEIPADLWNAAYGVAVSQRRGVGAASLSLPGSQTVETTAKGIAEYRLAPLSSTAMRGPYGQQVMARVLELNPEYQATEYGARASGARAFASGRQSDTVRSMSVVIDHLGTLQDLGEALQNRDVRRVNQLQNVLSTEFGFEGPVDFNAAKEIVGDEIAKAVIGGVNSERDRAALHDKLDAANSPEQMLGVIRTFKRLLTGQLGGLRQQYEHATGKSAADFDQLLSPRARDELGGLSPGGNQASPAAAPQQGGVLNYDAQGNRIP